MTGQDHPTAKATSAEVAREIAIEQAHVDLVYAELTKAQARAGLVEADGLARGRTDRTGDVRDEELTGLFERDALVFNAARRRSTLDTQYEGLVFGRLDLDHALVPGADGLSPATDSRRGAAGREVRYIGRLGVRDDDYEPLVVDWRAPAAAAFYRATPVEPMGVLRRRVLRCKGADVVGVEDDLMVAEAPDDLVVVGDGALLAALTRSRGAQMRDIVATIQRHQDEAIRASARGVTEITGGPGTGKTVVALHRAAYLLYSDRRRFESGGILVVGPSAAYTAYIERVLPSLGEESVTLRSLGDVIDGVSASRLDPPDVAAVKGSLRIRRVLARAAADAPPEAPEQFRAFVGGKAVRVDRPALDRIRAQVLRNHQRNLATKAVEQALAEAAWASVREGDRAEFMDHFHDHLEVEAFLDRWWPQVDPREALLWLADAERARHYGHGVLSPAESDLVSQSIRTALETGRWSVADAALVDDLAARLGPVQDAPAEERGFYEIEELDDLSQYGVTEVHSGRRATSTSRAAGSPRAPHSQRERLLQGSVEAPGEYAHVLVDEAQDLSPMQWRMLGRRGRYSSWTVVGDAAQASWPDGAEAGRAREEAFGSQQRRRFHMDTNYRNAREIFDYAAEVVRAQVPDADIPQAVRETGVEPVDLTVSDGAWVSVATDAVETLLGEVEGSIAVVTPARHSAALSTLSERDDRIVVIDPMSTKGLEYDATVIVDPDEITAESPGGVRVLYVALTRAAHRMTVLRPA
ncbi:HelD family protein [Pedococcus sp.]|uniref:HelD family protein n=1 Tax=Pedococcus sp. TaxID=2860345 RepID=UPI002E0E940B|nr:AAA family ATPase [Pedococcus sp.]